MCSHICVIVSIYVHFVTYTIFYLCSFSDDGESDTADTDDDERWGGLGMFEYSKKGLPHALVHASDLVMEGGHHLAFCSSVAEVSHKMFIKLAAKFGRTYASHNVTESKMLEWVCWNSLFRAVTEVKHRMELGRAGVTQQDTRKTFQRDDILLEPLPFTGWSQVVCGDDRTPRSWGATFLSKRVLITRDEMLTLMRTKLEMEPTLANNVRLLKELRWEFYGVYCTYKGGRSRRYVGISSKSPGRRDFVRLRGAENGTAYAAQVNTTYTCF